MIEQEAARTSEKETGRLEAFSDGVFAIAITLLVLNLSIPTNLTPITPSTLAAALWQKWPTYIIFIISFATILIMWVYHHRLFQSVRKAQTSLLFANGFLLLLVTVVPFPTNLVGTYLTTPAASVACAAYAGFFVLINASYNLLWLVILKQQPDYKPGTLQIPRSMIGSLLGLPCYIIATLIAFWNPYVTLSLCIALWILWAITSPYAIVQPQVSKD